jgi:hypothetical protein
MSGARCSAMDGVVIGLLRFAPRARRARDTDEYVRDKESHGTLVM